MGFHDWLEYSWFRWLVKGGLGAALSFFVFKIGEWFYNLPFPLNTVFLTVLGIGYGYAIEEIGVYGGGE